MPAITGSLQTVLNDEADVGSVEIALCGYGSQVPRLNAAALGARVTDGTVEVGQDGAFQFNVVGNDVIIPQGTYYTVTIKNENGDITQVNAYTFLSTSTEYDLDTTMPFDPSASAPPSIPPPVQNLLLTVAFDPAAVFPGDTYTSWEMWLTGDTAPTFINLVDGNLYTVILYQDNIGSHQFLWPDIVFNGITVDPEPNSTTVQTLVAVNGQLFAVAPGTWYP